MGMILEWSDWHQAVGDPRWLWPHFSPEEMACKCCGCVKIDSEFMDRLEVIRERMAVPLPVNSGYRCPAHNSAVSSTGEDGPHTTGSAADIAISGRDAFDLIGWAYELGFTGIGVRQHGDHSGRFIHVDLLGDGRPTVWSYK
jgi:zinc D-Ala-D-Ala carboxypeptidase